MTTVVSATTSNVNAGITDTAWVVVGNSLADLGILNVNDGEQP